MPPASRPKPSPGQESVWDYPRPPRIDPSQKRVQVWAGDLLIADTTGAVRVLETSHPPGWYLPPGDVRTQLLRPSATRSTVCEWKGAATYWDVVADDVVVRSVGWSYPVPTKPFTTIAGWFAFYPSKLRCVVDGVDVTPQEGRFYGGWITPDVIGPFKGSPGTWGW